MSTAIDNLIADIREDSRSRFQRYEELAEQSGQMGYEQAAKLIRAITFSEKARLKLYHQCLTLETDAPKSSIITFVPITDSSSPKLHLSAVCSVKHQGPVYKSKLIAMTQKTSFV